MVSSSFFVKLQTAVLLAAIVPRATTASTSACGALPTAVANAGTIIGTTTVLSTTASATAVVNKFLGIPYAVTPPRRFSPPESLNSSHSTLVNATATKGICIQENYVQETADQIPTESEDCLYLNIWTPPFHDDEKKAVMFWIHGGDLSADTGSSPTYDGSSFAANQDVVIVTINYRLNAFGFPNSPELPIEQQNVGFWDQRKALEWVRDNIAAFGGDPQKVTLFGESAGSASVDRMLTTMPGDDPPFFRAAIQQSGQATLGAVPRDAGPASWAALVAAVNCTDAASQLGCVRAADAFAIREVVSSLGLSFRPANDNVTQLATPLLAARAAGAVARVPLLAGTNAKEGNAIAYTYGITDWADFTETELEEIVYAVAGGNTSLVQELVQFVHDIAAEYPWFNLFEATSLLDTELLWQCPCKIVSEASAQANIPTYRYYYNASIPNLQMAGYPDLGAYHGSELNLVFGTYNSTGSTEQEVELSAVMQKAWADFAKDPYGGPGWPKVDGDGNGVIACIGCNGSSGVVVIPESEVDERCELYRSLYTSTTSDV